MRTHITILALLVSTMIYSQKLDVEGTIQIADSEDPLPVAGMIRWTGYDFEGWNGFRWVSLTSAPLGTVSDVDENVYKTMLIGSQEWMLENLQTSKYNDNTAISQVTPNEEWIGLTTGAWCWYGNDSSNELIYGKLYNWYAVETTKLCPVGWEVPSDTAWDVLQTHLAGMGVAGGKMKEAGLVHWDTPNTGATNESGFTGLPGGLRGSLDGTFFSLGAFGHWWSSTESGINSAWYRFLSYNTDDLGRGGEDSEIKKLGFSVRCIKST